jgi:hypothetical protein
MQAALRTGSDCDLRVGRRAVRLPVLTEGDPQPLVGPVHHVSCLKVGHATGWLQRGYLVGQLSWPPTFACHYDGVRAA